VVAELNDEGYTTRAIAAGWNSAETGKPYSHQHIFWMIKTYRCFVNLSLQDRPRWNTAYNSDEVRGRQQSNNKNEPMPELPNGQYRCIVIDPPWPMQKIEREVRPKQGKRLDYPVMTLEEIAALPIGNLATSDGCHLYLWTTQKYLPTALEMVEGWGFRYQCLMTWRKNVGITPYSWMYDTEHVIFARLGSLQLQELGLRLSFEAPVTRHSEKPDIFFDERVIPASPEPRLEMFARKVRDGFTVWGDEV
jgi:N6-adenosine-specific RNA methylase IME4